MAVHRWSLDNNLKNSAGHYAGQMWLISGLAPSDLSVSQSLNFLSHIVTFTRLVSVQQNDDSVAVVRAVSNQ